MLTRVLFPAPFSPSSAWISPRRRSKSTWSLATIPGKVLTMPRASSAGTGAGDVTGCVPMDGEGPTVVPWAPESLGAELRQVGGDAVRPPVHAGLALVAGSTGRELVEVGLLELGSAREELLALVVLDRAGEDVEPVERPGEHLGQRVLDLGDILGRQVGDALLVRLTVHEPVQAHRLRIGVEVLVAGLIRLGLDLLGDPDVLRSPDPVRRGQARVVLARCRVVVGDRPLALRRGRVGDGRGVGAGEHDIGAGGVQRVG